MVEHPFVDKELLRQTTPTVSENLFRDFKVKRCLLQDRSLLDVGALFDAVKQSYLEGSVSPQHSVEPVLLSVRDLLARILRMENSVYKIRNPDQVGAVHLMQAHNLRSAAYDLLRRIVAQARRANPADEKSAWQALVEGKSITAAYRKLAALDHISGLRKGHTEVYDEVNRFGDCLRDIDHRSDRILKAGSFDTQGQAQGLLHVEYKVRSYKESWISDSLDLSFPARTENVLRDVVVRCFSSKERLRGGDEPNWPVIYAEQFFGPK